jgi:tetratricopeptide (TPR) repeat protein
LISTLFAPDHAKAYVALHGTVQVGHEKSAASLLWPIVNDVKLEKLLKHLDEIMSRAKEIGWDLKIRSQEMTKPNPLSIARMIKEKASSIFNARMASTLGNYLATAYITNRDKGLSQKYVDCILMLSERPRPGDLNNIGYVALSRGDYESAELFLTQALQSNERFDAGLTLYNLAICRLLTGKTSDALSYLRRAKDEPESDSVGCIISVEESGASLVPKEIFDVDSLRPHIAACIELCGKLQDDQLAVTN